MNTCLHQRLVLGGYPPFCCADCNAAWSTLDDVAAAREAAEAEVALSFTSVAAIKRISEYLRMPLDEYTPDALAQVVYLLAKGARERGEID